MALPALPGATDTTDVVSEIVFGEGGGLNVVGNIGFLVLFGIPLLADRSRAARPV
jgi:hypothetical protein